MPVFKKKRKRNTYTVDGLINGRLISGWAYIRNKIFCWQMDGLISGGGLKTGGGLKVGFYGMLPSHTQEQALCHHVTHIILLRLHLFVKI